MTTPTLSAATATHWAFLWVLVGLTAIALEFAALGSGHDQETLSYVIRTVVRFDPVGRFFFLPLCSWLLWHWVLAPQRFTGVRSIWDLVFILAGVLYALGEARHRLP